MLSAILNLPQIVKTVQEQTSSGGFCSNDGIIHPSLPSFPFGGVGGCRLHEYPTRSFMIGAHAPKTCEEGCLFSDFS